MFLFLKQHCAICISVFDLPGKNRLTKLVHSFTLFEQLATHLFSDSEAGGRGNIGFGWHYCVHICGLI